MRYRSIKRAIRRGHLVWVKNTLIECLELFRLTRYGKEYYGMTIPYVGHIPFEPEEAEPKKILGRPSFWNRVLNFFKSLFR